MIKMEELLCSIHNYTKFSGNNISFYELAQAGLDCGLDILITTDRNIYPDGQTQYYFRSCQKLLLICGEELYDPIRPNSTHYLALGIEKEQFNLKVQNPQGEIRILVGEKTGNQNFRHTEIINSQEVLQKGIDNGLRAIKEKLLSWDNMLNNDQRVVGTAGSCISPDLKPYTYKEILSTACNHLFTEEKLNGDMTHDKLMVLKAIKNGASFFALDGLSDAKGFRFSAEGDTMNAPSYPGDIIYLKNSITVKISIPETCTCRLIRNGNIIKEWRQCRQVPYTIYEPGHYRVECALSRRNQLYGWIFTNPIYVVRG